METHSYGPLNWLVEETLLVFTDAGVDLPDEISFPQAWDWFIKFVYDDEMKQIHTNPAKNIWISVLAHS